MLKIKQEVTKKTLSALEDRVNTLKRANAEAQENTMGAETKSESKYDTRGIEASYLAEGQREQLAQLEIGLEKLKHLISEDEPDNAILGSLVVLSHDKGEINYQILPAGGGNEVSIEETSVITITPSSPIGTLLLGKMIGDSIQTTQFTNAYISEIY